MEERRIPHFISSQAWHIPDNDNEIMDHIPGIPETAAGREEIIQISTITLYLLHATWEELQADVKKIRERNPNIGIINRFPLLVSYRSTLGSVVEKARHKHTFDNVFSARNSQVIRNQHPLLFRKNWDSSWELPMDPNNKEQIIAFEIQRNPEHRARVVGQQNQLQHQPIMINSLACITPG